MLLAVKSNFEMYLWHFGIWNFLLPSEFNQMLTGRGWEDQYHVLIVKICPVLRKWEPKGLCPLYYEMDYNMQLLFSIVYDYMYYDKSLQHSVMIKLWHLYFIKLFINFLKLLISYECYLLNTFRWILAPKCHFKL